MNGMQRQRKNEGTRRSREESGPARPTPEAEDPKTWGNEGGAGAYPGSPASPGDEPAEKERPQTDPDDPIVGPQS
jgi:hypothetical protein